MQGGQTMWPEGNQSRVSPPSEGFFVPTADLRQLAGRSINTAKALGMAPPSCLMPTQGVGEHHGITLQGR